MPLYPIYRHEMVNLAEKLRVADTTVFATVTGYEGDYESRALHLLIFERERETEAYAELKIPYVDRRSPPKHSEVIA